MARSDTPSQHPLYELVLRYMERHPDESRVPVERLLADHPELTDQLAPLLEEVSNWSPAEIEERLARSTSRTESELGANEERTEALGSPPAKVREAPRDSDDPTMSLGGATVPAGDPQDDDEFDDGVTLADGALDDPGSERKVIDRRYEVVDVLGEGGFGRVYLVEDQLYEKEQRALKVILPVHSRKPEFGHRFKNEIRVLRALSHPGIPAIYNDGRTADGGFYYTMAYVEGRPLSQVLRKEAPLEPERVVRLVKQLLAVLGYAHSKGVVHRDLKPPNVLLTNVGTADERVHVLDFGIAKVLGSEGDLSGAKTLNTVGGIGTPHYMSPEQLRGGSIDASTDVYALGILIYQMCSGAFPFSGKSDLEIATARLEQNPTPLPADKVPPWLGALVMQLLQRDQRRRPKTAEIQKQLDQLAQSQGRLTKSLRWVAAALVLVAAGVVWTRSDAGAEEPLSSAGVAPKAEADAGVPDGGEQGSAGGDELQETAIVPKPVPRAALTILQDGGHVSSDGLRLQGTATGVERLVAFVGETKRDIEVSDGRFDATVGVPEGKYSIKLVEPDDPENVLTQIDELVVDRTAPDIVADVGELRRHPDGEAWFLTDVSSGVSVSAQDVAPGELDEVRVNGKLHAPDAGGLAPERDGRTSYTLTARDRAGNESRQELVLIRDTKAPSLSVDTVQPTLAMHQGNEITLTGSVSDQNLSGLEWRVSEDQALDVTVSEGGKFELELPFSFGDNLYRFVARDLAGHETEAELSVTRLAYLTSVVPDVAQLASAGPSPAIGSASDPFVVKPSAESLTVSGEAACPLSKVVVIERPDAEMHTDGRSFSIELPVLSQEVERFEIVPYDEQGRPGASTVLALRRGAVLVPSGCERAADSRVDESGWAAQVVQDDSGIELMLVPSVDGSKPFYIGRYEVTWEQYLREYPVADEELRAFSRAVKVTPEDLYSHPANKIPFADAGTFCQKLGLRIPTLKEWKLAALGPHDQAFPWGDYWFDGYANIGRASATRTAPVGSFTEDRSDWSGAQDLLGNVMEWCTSSGAPMLVGSCFDTDVGSAKLLAPHAPPRSSNQTIGFRVLKELDR